MQTLAWNSKFKENIYGDSMRLFDWNRGKPYIYREADFFELINSEKLFARKFSNSVDPKIIDTIEFYFQEKNTNK